MLLLLLAWLTFGCCLTHFSIFKLVLEIVSNILKDFIYKSEKVSVVNNLVLIYFVAECVLCNGWADWILVIIFAFYGIRDKVKSNHWLCDWSSYQLNSCECLHAKGKINKLTNWTDKLYWYGLLRFKMQIKLNNIYSNYLNKSCVS